MKKNFFHIIIISTFIFVSFSVAKAQYSFSFFPDTFNFLDTNQATHITLGSVWGYTGPSVYYLPIGFDFYINGDVYDSLKAELTDGTVRFFQQCHFPLGPSGPELMGFFTGLVDRGEYTGTGNIPFSPVRYITEGNPGSKIFKLEWKNTAFMSGDWFSWMNFQIWLYETSNVLEIRFGSSFQDDTTDIWTYNGGNGPLVTWTYYISNCNITGGAGIWVYGYRNNPQYANVDSLNPTPPQMEITGVPDSGMVYRFTPWPLLIEEKYLEKAISIYPNPANGYFYIRGNFELPAIIELYDIMGRKVYRQPVISNRQQVDVSSLVKGMYIYKLSDKAIFALGKLIVE